MIDTMGNDGQEVRIVPFKEGEAPLVIDPGPISQYVATWIKEPRPRPSEKRADAPPFPGAQS